MSAITAATIIAGIGAAGSLIGALGSKGGGSAPAPMITPPKVMPTPDDDAMRAQKRKALAGLSQRRGRASTILSDDSDGDLLGG